MRARQLIEQLKKCDPEAEVMLLCCDDDPLNGEGFDINRVYEIRYADKSESIVYVDGTIRR